MEALLSASLDVADGCVYAQSSGGRTTLVWPEGYTVSGDSKSFEVLDGNEKVVARSGTALAIGGGAVASVDDAWGEQDCATGSLWMVGEVSTA